MFLVTTIACWTSALAQLAPAAASLPAGKPTAVFDLLTREDAQRLHATWRFHEARPVEVDFKSAGADRKPSGPPNRTWDIEPHAGGASFDDSSWEVVDPTTLGERRASGKLCFAWYRCDVTIPESSKDLDATGMTAVLDVVVDDYAEVWVDGELPRELGQRGGALIAGWNAPNRLVIGRDLRPGRTIHLAIFGANGPLSDPPPNYIWMRSARVELFREPHAFTPKPVAMEVERHDAALDALLGPAPRVEQLASGFEFTEGPVQLSTGDLLFSDPNHNVIYRWASGAATSESALRVFRDSSGYSGADIALFKQPGSNGLALDPLGRLTICEHGNRRVTRLEADGTTRVLAERYEGRRLNSPNDLVYRSDGALYFTDPPFGLPKFHDDPRRESPYTGVYLWKPDNGGTLQLVSNDLRGPNGLAFSPDERALYVANWDESRKVVMRYDVAKDGTLSNGAVFFDMRTAREPEALDGLKVDLDGNLFVSGPGGLWILSPSGVHLGTLRLPELPANFAWASADRRTLFLTARTGLYRLSLASRGARGSDSNGGARSIGSIGGLR